ncbi:MAG: hypothetical protein U0869_19755 [Chloroflexota bacterium]
MATVKVSVTLDERWVTEAKTHVGARGLSRFINEALALRLQSIRVGELLDAAAQEHGPIPDEVLREVEAAFEALDEPAR